MGVYTKRARRSREDDLALIITDGSTTITRTRKTHPDKMRAEVIETLGPLVVRVAQFKATRSAVNFDEKGSSATAAYVLMALNRPTNGAGWTIPKTAFKLNDLLEDADGNTYRISGPARWDGNAVEVNVELQG